jgi:hypothetical protein
MIFISYDRRMVGQMADWKGWGLFRLLERLWADERLGKFQPTPDQLSMLDRIHRVLEKPAPKLAAAKRAAEA